MAMDTVVLNLWGPVHWKEGVWTDDGQLPNATGMHHTFAQHRPITGQEEFLLRGYDIARLKFTGIPDMDLVNLADSKEGFSLPVPVVGAVLIVSLCCADR